MMLKLFLAISVLVSATGVVYAKHESRQLFIELQSLQEARDKLNVRWGRLQLEQSTWATHGRIEDIAREKLGMKLPRAAAVVIVKP